MNSRISSRLLIPAMVAAAGIAAPQAAFAQRGMVTVPSDTVVQLKLDQRLSSRDTVVGETFAAVLDEDDRSGFPEGTRFQGVVTEVQRHTKDRPGMLDVEFRRAYLPDGQKVTVDGRLASLEEDAVRRTDNGRLESKKNGGGKMDWKWAGIGAGAGLVLGTIFGGGSGGDLVKGAILGGLGGAAYGYLNRDKGKKGYRDVDLPRNTEFGMLLERRVAFDERGAYRYTARSINTDSDRYNERAADRRDDRLDRREDRIERREDRYTDRRSEDDRVLGDRQEGRLSDAAVRVDGRSVSFASQKPREINGVLYVPLNAVAEAAGMRLIHRRSEQNFVLDTRNGLVDGRAGDSQVYLGQDDSIRLTDGPVLLGGTIFVSREFLDKAAGMRVDWDSSRNALDLETRR